MQLTLRQVRSKSPFSWSILFLFSFEACILLGAATELDNLQLATYYGKAATDLKATINDLLWDNSTGAYIDNPTSTLHPQDGNSLMVWLNVTLPERKSQILANLKENWVEFGAQSPEWIYNGAPGIGTFPGSMEVLAHLSAGATDDGLQLINLTWGYMLNSPNSTASTFWEGFQSSGQFAFQGIYMSHAHGWSTGPASALSFYTLGLRPAGTTGNIAVDSTNTTQPELRPGYEVAPQLGSLASCQGSLALHGHGTGSVHVSWQLSPRVGKLFRLIVDSTEAPVGSIGRVGLPLAQLGFDSEEDAQITFEHGHTSAVGKLSSLPRGLSELKQAPQDGRKWYEFDATSKLVIDVS